MFPQKSFLLYFYQSPQGGGGQCPLATLAGKQISNREKLFDGTVPPNKNWLGGTVTSNKTWLGGTLTSRLQQIFDA